MWMGRPESVELLCVRSSCFERRESGMIRDPNPEAQQFGYRLQESLGLPEGEAVDDTDGECRLNREVRVDQLTTWPTARRSMPSLDRILGEPQCQLAALAEACLVLAPVTYLVPLRSGKGVTSRPLPPLRTAHDSFPSRRSSLSRASRLTRFLRPSPHLNHQLHASATAPNHANGLTRRERCRRAK